MVPVPNLPECGNFLLFLFSQLPHSIRLKYYIFPLDAPPPPSTRCHGLKFTQISEDLKSINLEKIHLLTGQLIKQYIPSIIFLAQATDQQAEKCNTILQRDIKTQILVHTRPQPQSSHTTYWFCQLSSFGGEKKCKSILQHNTEF